MSLNSVILISIRIKQKVYSKTLIQLSNSSILQSILTFLISLPIQNNFSRTPSTPTFSPPNPNFQSFNRSSSPKSTIKHEKNIWAEQTRFALLCRRIANILIEAVFPELSNHATLLPPPLPAISRCRNLHAQLSPLLPRSGANTIDTQRAFSFVCRPVPGRKGRWSRGRNQRLESAA